MKSTWRGIFPAVTTQFHDDESLNLEATCRNVNRLVDEGVNGIVALGTVGENYALSGQEKERTLNALAETVAGRVPLLSGVAETTTAGAIEFTRAAEGAGVDGLMVLPGLVYHSGEDEAVAHFRRIAASTALPIMLYNNPITYGVDLGIAATQRMVDIDNVVAIKESTTDVRRLSELRSAFGQRFRLFCGVDDIILPSLATGAEGWVSGLSNVFPAESLALMQAAQKGDWERARALFDWFLPLLRLDTVPKLVQCIKLCEALMQRGSETVRAPRQALSGAERSDVEARLRQALEQRPD